MNRTFDTNQSIGEYRIVDFIGAGGMGEVYRAMHSKIGRVAAVKVLTQTDQASDFVERFFNEARIQASLQHPNIATLYDFCEVAGQPCIIMEYVDGQTISERVAAYRAASGAPPPLSETVYIFGRVVEAIEYVHRHGIIHRDIKSNNIKVSSDGQVKLLDFGIAKGQASPGLTQVGS
ncbi:MAG TPA: serine/threonine-protein kinase, partial [Pyrinomonadaceae bacterium]|nr:serine/threonine-protein kinase [Pyrinomonadaceae bacterium]